MYIYTVCSEDNSNKMLLATHTKLYVKVVFIAHVSGILATLLCFCHFSHIDATNSEKYTINVH